MFGSQGPDGFGGGNGSRGSGGRGYSNNNRPKNNYPNERSQASGSRNCSRKSSNRQNLQPQQGVGTYVNRNQSTRRDNRGSNSTNPFRDGNEDSNNEQTLNHQQLQQQQEGNSSDQKKRFEGPVFGFKRLLGFLSADPNEVISNMSRNLKEWEILLEKDSIAAIKTLRNGRQEMSDDWLVLIVTLLAEKVLCDTIVLESKQIALIASSASCRSFLSKIDSKCKSYMFQDGDICTPNRSNFNDKQNETTVDQSRMRWFRNLYKIFNFVAIKMKFTALDFLGKLIPSALGTLAYLLNTDVDNMAEITKLLGSFQQLKKIMDDIKKDMEKKSKDEEPNRRRKYDLTPDEEQMLHELQPPDDYKEISIIPSISELKSTEPTFLRTNKITGAYIDANHYLDVQFRLLREDFVRPLKIGIQDYMKYKIEYLTKKKKPPIGNVRIYHEVRLTKSDMVKGTMIQFVQLHPSSYTRVKWDKSKRLLIGSLLVFTSDDFASAYFAIVHSRDENDLKRGIFGITWEGLVPDFSTKEEILYSLVESENYFEAYKHTLKILKEIELENFPMAKFIVDASSEVRAPSYLMQNRHLLSIGTLPPFSPLLDCNWPSCHQLKLDEMQYRAFKACLTREFAIVQGPPGTGKTFLALQIVEVFLRNTFIWNDEDDERGVGPILVVCYTNHALDSFLEGILKVFHKIGQKPSMTRVGGRSKTEALDEFSLMRQRNVAAKFRQYDASYARMKREAHEAVRGAENVRARLMTELYALNNIDGIVDLNSLTCSDDLLAEIPKNVLEAFRNPEWFGIDSEFGNSKMNDFERLKRWFNVQKLPVTLLNPPQTSKKLIEIEQDSDSGEDYDLDELQENRLIDDIYMEAEKTESHVTQSVGKTLKYLHNDVKRITQHELFVLRSQEAKLKSTNSNQQGYLTLNNIPALQKLRADIEKQENELSLCNSKESFVQLVLKSYKEKTILLSNVDPFVQNNFEYFDRSNKSHMLSKAQKWAIFFFCLERAKKLSAIAIKHINDELFNAQKQLQEVMRYGDGQIMKKSKILGMTTTGAAKYNDLVRMARSRIVIVEEAAEVLESHIVTCLTTACQHLILIGDHQQLRPSTTVYELSTQYKLDISLFERMVNNKLNCFKINVQHRMRPEIANLVVETIYPELYNAPSVYEYPPVDGVICNLFFITHNEAESSESDTKSRSNEHEAKFVAALSRYLIQQGYATERITILTTYLGQMFLIKQKLRNYKTCNGIRVTCVDNFQGEENDIIILSLVRSNEEGNIGFLKTDNRICVAVSRAKHGLFIIGNMSKLAAKSETWRKIQNKFNNRNEIGTSLTIECKVHGTISDVSSDQQFQRHAPEGGCTNICGAQLTTCSHQCAKVCHKDDPQHQKYNCHYPCEKSCTQGHPCKDKCYKSCSPCSVALTKTLACGHTPTLACHVRVETVTCRILVEKTLPCGHKETMACFVDQTQYICKVKVSRLLQCRLHIKEMECNKNPMEFKCKVMVKKTLACNHEQEDCCYINPKDIGCETEVIVTHKKCGHKEKMMCQMAKKADLKCRSKCTTRLSCGHTCTLICHPDNDPDHLHFECTKNCGRICATTDNFDDSEHRCQTSHPCYTPCPPCKKVVNRKLPCKHEIDMECYKDVHNMPCVQPCSKTLDCQHKCKGLCNEQCPPCWERVMKNSLNCIHRQMMPCSMIYSRSRCEFKMDPSNFSICGHSVKVPCKLARTISPIEILRYCEEPCQFLFQQDHGGCGHTCRGTCSQCLYGRLHVKCQEECGKTLICGHRCNFPCSSSCPPCQQQCIFSCEHSNCKAKCGEPCAQCTEPCQWRCIHKACTKLCSDPCDREPCDEPCNIKLKCGHSCIGYCGEKCPTQCRICNRSDLTEFVLYGNEEDDDARFILLEDCGHAIEHEGLDYYMKNDIEEGEITAKSCPRCKTLISRSRRYGNVIKRRLKDVQAIKIKKFGMTKETERTHLTLMQKLRIDQDLSSYFPAIIVFILEILCKEVPDKNGTTRTKVNKVNASTLMTLDVMVKHLEDAFQQVTEQSINARGERIQLKVDLQNDLVERFNKLFEIMMSRQMPLSITELEDFDLEFHRLYDLKQIYFQISTLKYNIREHDRGSLIFKNLMEIIDHPCFKYDLPRKNSVKQLLKQLEKELSTGLGISEREKQEILNAFNMREGRWFKCPNGHYYVITECGGAMQEGTCNECGATIGGGNHRLRSDNHFAGEFDGASRPLWPQ